jgi:hypothetical protein
MRTKNARVHVWVEGQHRMELIEFWGVASDTYLSEHPALAYFVAVDRRGDLRLVYTAAPSMGRPQDGITWYLSSSDGDA